MAKALFKKKPEAERRTVAKLIKWTSDEVKKVEHAASIRQLDFTEFVRRAALGRKADVHYDVEIVLELRSATRAIRDLYNGMIERGIAPPEEEMRQCMLESREAMLRISK